MQPIITNSFNPARLEPMAVQFHEQRNKTSIDMTENISVYLLCHLLIFFKVQPTFWLKSLLVSSTVSAFQEDVK